MMRKILYYLPRVLTIIVAVFLYLFVAEAFTPGFGWGAGLSHFILATVVLLLGIVAWKKPLIGGWLLILPLLVSFIMSRGGFNSVFAALALIGLLYLVGGYLKNKQENNKWLVAKVDGLYRSRASKLVSIIVICLLVFVVVFGVLVIIKDRQQIAGLEEMIQRDEALYPSLEVFHKYPIDGTHLYGSPEK